MKTLLVGYRAADLSAELLTGEVTCHTLDIYHRHAIEKVHHVKAVCSAHLPEEPWDLIKFKTGPKIHSGELALDLLQEINLLQKKCGAKVEVDFVGKERDKNDLLNKIKNDPDRVRDFSAKWFASVPGGPKLEFTSFPGCFCHRRLDEGGLALAEVVVREGERRKEEGRGKEVKILDMGCGCGLVGLLIAKSLPPPPSSFLLPPSSFLSPPPSSFSLTLVDSHSRAVEAAELNAKAFGVEAEVVLSDNGTPARMDGTFDIFVGNPPYYSDYRIADVFLETAKRALKSGGICYTVCKNAEGLKPVQKRYFPEVEIIKRRGYAVLKSKK